MYISAIFVAVVFVYYLLGFLDIQTAAKFALFGFVSFGFARYLSDSVSRERERERGICHLL